MIYEVPASYTWAKLAQPAMSLNASFQAGETCALLKEGHVEVIGTDPEFGTLVRYSLPAGGHAVGALCPDQALIFLPPGLVASWPEQEVTVTTPNEETRRHRAVKRLLEG